MKKSAVLSCSACPCCWPHAPIPATSRPHPRKQAQCVDGTSQGMDAGDQKLGETAWQSTKDVASDAAVKQRNIASAKDATARAVDATTQTTSRSTPRQEKRWQEVLEAGKEGAVEACRATRESTAEAYEATKQTATEDLRQHQTADRRVDSGRGRREQHADHRTGQQAPAMPDATEMRPRRKPTGQWTRRRRPCRNPVIDHPPTDLQARALPAIAPWIRSA